MLIFSYPLPHVLEACRVTVAFVADSWLFDPRVRCDKTYITTLVYNRHLPIVELYYASRDAGQTVPDILLFTSVRVYYLTTVEGKEFLPGSVLSIWTTEAGSKNTPWFRVCHVHCGSATSVVLPCAVSSTRTWVNQLLTLVHY